MLGFFNVKTAFDICPLLPLDLVPQLLNHGLDAKQCLAQVYGWIQLEENEAIAVYLLCNKARAIICEG